MLHRLRGRRRNGERGAALVEFAIVAPLLLTLVFGIVEFGWVFSQHLDVRHGAREGARLAAVNFPVGPTSSTTPSDANRDALILEACNRMTNKVGTNMTITAVAVGTIPAGARGSKAIFLAKRQATTLTGFLNWALPSTLELKSTVEIRLEQPASWTNGVDISC